jgi:hypothetical protein
MPDMADGDPSAAVGAQSGYSAISSRRYPMLLVSVTVSPFKSINDLQTVAIDAAVTVLVGMNESGKTVFLQSLEKSNDALGVARFNPIEDYPRKDLPSYLRKHKLEAQVVTYLTYRLTDGEVLEMNSAIRTRLQPGFTFTVVHYYDNTISADIRVEEGPVIETLLAASTLSSDALAALKCAGSIRSIPELLSKVSLTEEDKAFLGSVQERISRSREESVVKSEAWGWLEPRVPRFLYFGEYELLPSKMNLTELAQRVGKAQSDPRILKPEHRAVLALLRMADISIEEFTSPGGYEPLKAKIEGISINLTDQIMQFWKQNEDLEVEVDIKPDSDDEVPFNNGPNLYLRIKNRRHRGVSTPFRQRSRGFVWFFSFLIWFDSVRHQLEAMNEASESDIVLLLDEPGLSLHALAQADLLRYIDELSKRHQVLYTTHSPFMVNSDRLSQVRVIEDRPKRGTVISDNVSGSDAGTIFPLQAALGWSIAQNLFISKRNLLVEGPSDLIYLRAVSAVLDAQGRTGLRPDVTIVPVGGLDKVATFVALLGASGLKFAVFHDYSGTPEQKLIDLERQKIISGKALLNASQFRDLTNQSASRRATDTEDLFATDMYLEQFNCAFECKLAAGAIKEADLPPGERIIDRIERYLKVNSIHLRSGGGFNHYVVASHFACHPPASLSADTLTRFEALFKAINALL